MKTTIRIVEVPEGPAPLSIREKLVELILVVDEVITAERFSEISGREMDCLGVCIRAENFLTALDRVSGEASRWYRARAHSPDDYVVFQSDEVTVVDGSRMLEPTPKPIRMY